MQIKVSTGTPREAKVDLLAVPVFKIDSKKKLPGSLASLDKSTGGSLSLVVSQGDFRGTQGESQIIYPAKPGNAKRILLLGMGEVEKFDVEIRCENAVSVIVESRVWCSDRRADSNDESIDTLLCQVLEGCPCRVDVCGRKLIFGRDKVRLDHNRSVGNADLVVDQAERFQHATGPV